MVWFGPESLPFNRHCHSLVSSVHLYIFILLCGGLIHTHAPRHTGTAYTLLNGDHALLYFIPAIQFPTTSWLSRSRTLALLSGDVMWFDHDVPMMLHVPSLPLLLLLLLLLFVVLFLLHGLKRLRCLHHLLLLLGSRSLVLSLFNHAMPLCRPLSPLLCSL